MKPLQMAALLAAVSLSATLPGCTTLDTNRPTSIETAAKPAWSARAINSEMIVAVSPVRQSVQVVHSSVALLGAGIDAVVNARHKADILEALGDYDPGAVFEKKVETRLNEMRPGLVRVPPLQSTAGFHSERDAEKARRDGFARKGYDTLLDLKMTYGLFGYDGILVAKLEGRLILLPENKTLWKNDIVVSADPILASDRLSDPTNRMGPNLSSPRFTVEDNAIEKWTRDGGRLIRERFEVAVDGAVSAMLCDLGLADEASGHYYLGKLAMNRKKFKTADEHFRKSLAIDPTGVDAMNGRAVNMAHNKQKDDAIALAKSLTQSHPEYAPAWGNLAWFYAVDKKDPVAAKPFYEKAIALGMAPDKKLEKAINGKRGKN